MVAYMYTAIREVLILKLGIMIVDQYTVIQTPEEQGTEDT
jgi:hypothetical protein